eukprot:gnl/Hemi2/6306_TR2161_c0_g10_i1.p1 gnl/Hemi2/6306_TR2161_c0_g10~~gnl/Hemi2/6306_TR2161_c0_g10_i1.p1  ORF type:complete len:146 (-),score=56.79 gnl/Hemi2/6306_TR2161_c0_g10_i1:40-477(-)
MSTILFEDIFDVKDIDPDKKRFDRVSRLVCKSENYEMELVLDVNIQIYPMEINQKFSFALASSVSLDGDPDTGTYIQNRGPSLLDKYEYAMYGKVFKCEEEKKSGYNVRLCVLASFGGLLMRLVGDPRNLQSIELDQRIYLLMRR